MEGVEEAEFTIGRSFSQGHKKEINIAGDLALCLTGRSPGDKIETSGIKRA
jgi:hypothetical protein